MPAMRPVSSGRPGGRPEIRGGVIQGFFPGGRLPAAALAGARRAAQPQPGPHGLRMPPGPAPARTAQLSANGQAFAVSQDQLRLGSRGPGQRLPQAVQSSMESLFGASFGDVRIHVGPEAPAIGALAFTLGTDLYFAPGQYDPHTPRGQQLLAHELTHVVQQRAGRVRNPFGDGIAVVQDHALEAEAERMGMRALAQPRLAPGPR